MGSNRLYLANARMYAVTERGRKAWQLIFSWVAEQAGLNFRYVDYPPPAPLSGLWKRSDLGCVFMCGWPIARSAKKPKLLAAPIPKPDRYLNRPIYFTDIVVGRDSPYMKIEDTFGGVVGWTLEDSNSGFNTLRHYLLQFREPNRPNLYSKSIGSLINPLGALKAVAEGKVDIAPVDSFCLDLLRASNHPLTHSTRTIATTPASPISALVASADTPQQYVTKLQSAFLRVHEDRTLEATLDEVLVRRFVKPDISSYDYTEALANSAIEAGYAIPA